MIPLVYDKVEQILDYCVFETGNDFRMVINKILISQNICHTSVVNCKDETVPTIMTWLLTGFKFLLD